MLNGSRKLITNKDMNHCIIIFTVALDMLKLKRKTEDASMVRNTGMQEKGSQLFKARWVTVHARHGFSVFMCEKINFRDSWTSI